MDRRPGFLERTAASPPAKKPITGLTPIEYIREIRLQEARRLLENRLVGSVKSGPQRLFPRRKILCPDF